MQSLKPSIRSKSSGKFHAGASPFEPSSASKVADECFVFQQENHSDGLHSCWISRLLSPATTASEDLSAGKLANSTHEYRNPSHSFNNSNSSILRRCSWFPHVKPTPPKTKILDGDGVGRVLASFGPFKVRETGKSAYRVLGKGVFVGGKEVDGGRVRGLERKVEDEGLGDQVTPLPVQLGSRLTRGDAGVLEKGIAGVDQASSSRLQNCFGPWKVESRLKIPGFGSFLGSGGASLDTARRRGAAFCDISDGDSVSRTFQNIHNLHDNVIPPQPGIQIRETEAEEPFSFWNMGRYKRAHFVSSVSPSFDLSWNFDGKRKQNAEVFNSSKYRRI